MKKKVNIGGKYTVIRDEKLVKADTAPIDEKRVTTWIEEVFDDCKCVMTDERAVGFVKGFPVSAHWYNGDNTIWWNCGSFELADKFADLLRKREDDNGALFSHIGICGGEVMQEFYLQTDK